MSKYILIDTKYLDSSTNKYNFRYYLSHSINIKNYLKISYAYIPRLNYMIDETNNTFNITFYTNAGPHQIDIILPYQNFTPLSLVDYLKTFLSSFYNFNISYNQFTYKIEMTSDYDIALNLTTSDFNKLIGLDKKIYYSYNNNKKIITNCINFNRPSYITINFKNITTTNLISNNPSIQSNFIIPVGSKVNFGEILSYSKDIYDVSMIVNDININYLDIVILDDNNNVFKNNNSDWYMLLEYY